MFINAASDRRRSIILAAMALFLLAGVANAQNTTPGSDAAQANNPLAKLTAINLHNYYIGELTAPVDQTANQFWLRLVKPLSIGETTWIMRASLPINTYPAAPTFNEQTGLGDLTVFAS